MMGTTSDFTDIIRKRLASDPELAEAVENESFNSDIASQVYELRKEAGFTQRQLADKIGTYQSVIARLENADYDGHSLSMLRKIAKALNRRLRVTFYSEFQLPVGSQTAEKTSVKWPERKTGKFRVHHRKVVRDELADAK